MFNTQFYDNIFSHQARIKEGWSFCIDTFLQTQAKNLGNRWFGIINWVNDADLPP